MTVMRWFRPNKVEVSFREAVVSFCTDLTDPNGESTPIGVLLVARTGENEYYAAVIGARAGVETVDPLTAEFLSDFPEMLRRHLEKAASGSGGPSIDAILNRLHDSLRSSLSVTETTHLRKFSVERSRLLETLVKRATATLLKAASERGLVGVERSEIRKQRFEGPGRSMSPEAIVWPLEPCPA